MEDLVKYKKYFLKEDYLFKEISNNFSERKYLTVEEFFFIIIWKSNRSKTKVLDGVRKIGKTVEEFTKEIYNEKDFKNKVKILTEIEGIRIPIASAVLSVCYPNDFTIADYRVARTIKKEKFANSQIKNPTTSIDNYLEYIRVCKDIMKNKNLSSLRETDQILWGYDFYEGKDGLKELVSRLR